MRYYVVHEGQKYGPADIGTLNEWIGEQRILPHTMLEDEASGLMVAASTVPGLVFPTAAYPRATTTAPGSSLPPLSPRPYTPPTTPASGDLKPALLGIGLAILSPILTLFIGIGAIICFGYGFRSSLSAKDSTPIPAYIGMGLNVLAAIFWFYWRFVRP